MALLEEVSHWGQALRFQLLKPGLVFLSLSLLPVDPDVELSATSPGSCVPECLHASSHDDRTDHIFVWRNVN